MANYTGTSADDTITGTSGDDMISGLGGNDTLDGGYGNDTLEGGDGNDTMRGGLGDDHIFAGNGRDTIYGEAGDDMIFGGDAISVSGGAGADYIFASGTLDGGDGDDRFDVIGTGGVQAVDGGAGDDSFNLAWVSGFTNITVYGGDGDDHFESGHATQVLYGGAGNDTFKWGYGATSSHDTFVGGAGNDTYYYFQGLDITLVEAANEGQDKIYSNVGYILPDNFEDLEITGYGDLWATGNSANNILTTNDQNNVLDGKAGADTLIGGAGSDIYFVDNAGDTVVEALGWSNDVDTVSSSVSYTLAANVENLMLSGAANLNATGNAAANVLTGNSGNNILNGGDGSDQLIGGDGFDTASYVNAATGVTVFLGGPQLNTGEAAGDTYSSIENLTGSAFADILGGLADGKVDGGDGNDWIYGTTGAETLLGGNGNDVLEGRAGADILDGGAGIDVASYRNSTSGIRLDAQVTTGNLGDAAGDSLTGIENIWGTDFDDTIYGDDVGGQVYGFNGNDILAGRGGNDVMYGGVGADYLQGGTGADDFFYLSWRDHTNAYGTSEPYEGGDTIADFTHGTDHIIVSRYWFGFGNIGGSAAALTSTYADFKTSGGATSTRPTFFWNDVTKVLQFDPDGTGVGTAVTIATLTGATLTLSDIWTA